MEEKHTPLEEKKQDGPRWLGEPVDFFLEDDVREALQDIKKAFCLPKEENCRCSRCLKMERIVGKSFFEEVQG